MDSWKGLGVMLMVGGLAGCSTPVPQLPPDLTGVPQTRVARKLASTPADTEIALQPVGKQTKLVRFQWVGTNSSGYRLDRSQNLLDWQVVGTSIYAENVGTTNILEVIDTSSDMNKVMFYRIVPVDVNGTASP